MSNAPNLPAFLGVCQCSDCPIQVLAETELCALCKAAGCEVEGDTCEADAHAVQLLRHQTSQAGLELAAYGFRPGGWGGQVNYRGTLPDGRTAFILEAGGEYGPDSLFDAVEVFTDEDESAPLATYDTLSDFIATLPRPS
jgi:hypothetical protein